MATDHRKQSLYFPTEILDELVAQAERLDRSRSWIMQMAWRIARQEIAGLPTIEAIMSEKEPA